MAFDISPDGSIIITREHDDVIARVWWLETKPVTNGNDYDSIATGKWIDVFKKHPPKIDGAKVKFKDGILELNDSHLSLPQFTGRNMIVRARVKKLSGQNVGLLLRAINGESGRFNDYKIWMNSPTSRVGIGQIVKEDWKPLVALETPPFTAVLDSDGFVELAFSAINDQLTGYLDGEKIVNISDSTLTSGMAGVSTNIGRGQFKNVQVMLLDDVPKVNPVELRLSQILKQQPVDVQEFETEGEIHSKSGIVRKTSNGRYAIKGVPGKGMSAWPRASYVGSGLVQVDVRTVEGTGWVVIFHNDNLERGFRIELRNGNLNFGPSVFGPQPRSDFPKFRVLAD